MNVAHAVIESMRAHERKPSDFYPTPHDATQAVVPVLLQLGVKPGEWIADPSCGDGAMARVLEQAGFNVISSDLRHTGYGEGGLDYLGDFEDDPYDGSLGQCATFGVLKAICMNPPFSLADKFIRKAVGQAPVVAMLLKTDYWNSARGLRLWDVCPPTGRYEVTWRLAFLEEERGSNPLMNTTWFVWKRGDPPLPRPLPRPTTTPVLPRLVTVALAQNFDARCDLQGLLRGG